MPKSEEKVAEDRERRSSQFIATAAKRMASFGYDGTTVRDVAADMNVTSATLFHYFPSKNALLEAIIEVGVEHGLGIIRNAMGVDHAPLARLQRLIRAHVGILYGEMGHIHRVWTFEWVKLSSEARDRLRALLAANPDAVVCHPGPMNRGLEISADAADAAQSLVLDQVSAGVAVRMAVLYHLLAGEEAVA